MFAVACNLLFIILTSYIDQFIHVKFTGFFFLNKLIISNLLCFTSLLHAMHIDHFIRIKINFTFCLIFIMCLYNIRKYFMHDALKDA